MIISGIRNSHTAKYISIVTVFAIFLQLIPVRSLALTGGPSQPEVQSFEPIGTSDMVDVFSGDFKYNIPLMDVGGYPINISYHSGISMEQEASWVGLGWSLNPGAVNREMRGIPDDFNGTDKVIKEEYRRPNLTIGLAATGDLEIFGKEIKLNKYIGNPEASLNIGLRHNTYQGFDAEAGLTPALSLTKPNKHSLNMELGIQSNGDGLSFSPDISYSQNYVSTSKKNETFKTSIGTSYNTRAGLQALTFGVDAPRIRNGRTSFSFSPTYVPEVDMPMHNLSFTMSVKTGIALFGAMANTKFNGYLTEQMYLMNKIVVPAYGYIHSKDANPDQNVMMDFNREKEIPYIPEVPNLPVTNHTYDVFSVSGQGISGTFRPHLGAMGTVHKGKCYNVSAGESVGFEIGGSGISHTGIDLNLNFVNTQSGKWENNATSYLDFEKETGAPDSYESYYFKDKNEMASNIDQSLYEVIGGDKPARVDLYNNALVSQTTKTLETFDLESVNSTMNDYVNTTTLNRKGDLTRVKRNQLMTVLSAAEATYVGLEKKIRSYNNDPVARLLPGSNSSINELNRVVAYERNPHHISEVSVLQTNGSKYVYGIPAYNNSKKDVSFNVELSDPTVHNLGNNIISYNAGYDQPSNFGKKRGKDDYYSSTSLPPYAYSYLLTAALSPDYSDNDGVDGPSPNDNGTYTKFNYKRMHDKFTWRTPYNANTANLSKNLLSTSNDDKASYSEGTKEIWNLRSIETKTHVAIFRTSERRDAESVTGQKLQKLDRIDLYNLDDYYAYIDDPNHSPEIIKSVHFEYDYSLCGNVENNDAQSEVVNGVDINIKRGKLTLKKVYFTYGNVRKGQLSPYVFNYPSASNYAYAQQKSDRWGTYKSSSNPNGMENELFPYTVQDRVNQQSDEAPWTLNEILLPSGGKIKIHYESDDYAYVQNKKAMEMLTINGFGSSSNTASPGNTLYDRSISGGEPILTNKNYVFFPLASGLTAADYLLDENGDQMRFLYYSMMVDCSNGHGKEELIKGYAEIADYGEYNGNGWVKLINEDISDRKFSSELNPISIAAMQFYSQNLRDQKPEFQNVAVFDLVIEIAKIIPNTIRSIYDMFFTEFMMYVVDKRCQAVDKSRSYIRLFSPDQKKKGGGFRVAEVKMEDAWADMTADPNYQTKSYGQEYTYETTDPRTGKTISSGVASYEPMIGNDENPWRQPMFYSSKRRLARDPDQFIENPIGESFFPGASVGYSKVKVENLGYKVGQTEKINRHGSGHVIHEFYTAKDFPVKARSTEIEKLPFRTNPIFKLFRLVIKDFMTTSQGYSVEINDMHGKQKAQWVYAEGQNEPLSGVEYIYNTTGGTINSQSDNQTAHGELNNVVKVIEKTGSTYPVKDELIGVNVDFVLDSREAKTTAISAGLSPNANTFMAAVVPMLVPTIWPSFSLEKTRYRSVVATKVIHKHGLIKEVIAHDLGSQVATENMVYDKHTGDVLVTKTKNEYGDAKYSVSYPAHWEYDGMGQAYKNIDLFAEGVKIEANGVLNFSNATNKFGGLMVSGDEVLIGTSKYWVLKNVSSNPQIVDENGQVPTTANNVSVKIIRSGRRNLQNAPVGNVITRNNPIVNNKLSISAASGILDAESIIYSDAWQLDKGWQSTSSGTVSPCDNVEMGYLDFIRKVWDNCTMNTSKLCTASYPTACPAYIQTVNLASNETLTVYDRYGSVLRTLSDNFGIIIRHIGTYHVDIEVGTTESDGSWTSLTYLSLQIFNSNTTAESPITGFDPSQITSFTGGFLAFPSIASSYIHTLTNLNLYAAAKFMYNGTEYSFVVNEPTDMYSFCDEGSSSMFSALTKCGKLVDDKANPYYDGFRGLWKAKESFKYLTDRTQETFVNPNGDDNTELRTDGVYSAFTPFNWQGTNSNWQSTATVTLVDAVGNEIENKDPLDRHSSVIFGYHKKLPIAVAQNAMHKEIAFTGFEDARVSGSCLKQHFGFEDHNISITRLAAHSGNFSMMVSPGSSISTSRSLYPENSGQPTALSVPYKLTSADLIDQFSPHSASSGAQEYMMSYWVKLGAQSTSFAGVQDLPSTLKVKVGSTNCTVSAMQTNPNPVIDGWQQKNFTFTVPASSTGDIVIEIQNGSGDLIFVDDIRIMPVDAQMKSYVYDHLTHRLMAELDANNYATFYEYNEEGALVRVKKETERGIMMIQSVEQHSSHLNTK